MPVTGALSLFSEFLSLACRAAGRARIQMRVMTAEAAKVAASATSDVRIPKKPAIAPPAAKPATWATWYVVRVMALPSMNRSPDRMWNSLQRVPR